ncbi:hypothetical protein [Streptomyces sp. KM273126]|uniref:hypothetical protein n=1 Tax=Streptomyces sp. KM273126 TaxID=2545247 RepID=UPI00215DC2D8|nr:hypothetical protein [Streptomyces sp. KM273126]
MLGVLVAAQLAHHAVYSLPGACAAGSGADGCGGLSWLAELAEHEAVFEVPTEVVTAGHLVTVLLAARLLGGTERLLWQSRPLLSAVRRVLLFVGSLISPAKRTGPQPTVRERTSPPRSALLVRLHEGRTPPRHERGLIALFRPMPIGGPCLP